MKRILNFDVETLNDLGAYNTANEISQQPKLWRETLEIVKKNSSEISKFLSDKLAKENVRIIFSGAGTSAYIGDTVAPYISKILDVRVEAIATTDIVSSPENYFKKDVPTILVSFARSGNSPESVATYDLAEQLISDVSQVIITCNKDGELAKRAKDSENKLLLLMPEESNDKSFAMTSSFSCMLLTSLLIFNIDKLEENTKLVEEIISNGESLLSGDLSEILELVKLGYDRVVYLGSASLKGLSKEAALKNLELTSGKVNTMCESILGFRHGPKSITNNKTLIFAYVSNNEYSKLYDIDLIKEIYNDDGMHKIVTIAYDQDDLVTKISDKAFVVSKESNKEIDDAFIALNYILYAQIFALFYSLDLGIHPDNPRPDGTVNRVVQGVTIHQYK